MPKKYTVTGEKFRDTRQFCWNPDKGEFLGRTCKSWCQVLFFYIVFYGGLAGFFAICLTGFFATMDNRAPTQQYMYSLLKQNPGMGYRPRLGTERTLVQFQAWNPSTYDKYVKNLDESLSIYNESRGDNVIDCTNLKPEERDDSKVCDFEISMLGTACTKENNYGYSEGKPCILLKLNKIYGWMPDPLRNETADSPTGLGDRQDENFIGVTCEGENDADLGNIRNVTYYPPKGFPSVFYPYLNQPGYLPPVVMAQFDLVPGRLAMIWCKAWAKNIKHHRVDQQGSIHFELLVDKIEPNVTARPTTPTSTESHKMTSDPEMTIKGTIPPSTDSYNSTSDPGVSRPTMATAPPSTVAHNSTSDQEVNTTAAVYNTTETQP